MQEQNTQIKDSAEENFNKRRQKFIARVFGAIAGVATGIAYGSYLVRESLIGRVIRQFSKRNEEHLLERVRNADSEGNYAGAFFDGVHNPDPLVKSAVEDLAKNNRGFIAKLMSAFKARHDQLLEDEENLIRRAENIFRQKIDKLEQDNPTLNIKKEAEELISQTRHMPGSGMLMHRAEEFKNSIKEMYSSGHKNALGAIYPAFKKFSETKRNKQYGTSYLLSQAKEKLFTRPLALEIMKPGNDFPGRMGLGFRHADGKARIFVLSSIASVTAGAVIYGATRWLQQSYDRKKQESHVDRLAGERNIPPKTSVGASPG